MQTSWPSLCKQVGQNVTFWYFSWFVQNRPGAQNVLAPCGRLLHPTKPLQLEQHFFADRLNDKFAGPLPKAFQITSLWNNCFNMKLEQVMSTCCLCLGHSAICQNIWWRCCLNPSSRSTQPPTNARAITESNARTTAETIARTTASTTAWKSVFLSEKCAREAAVLGASRTVDSWRFSFGMASIVKQSKSKCSHKLHTWA